jgi:hypothetical protein
MKTLQQIKQEQETKVSQLFKEVRLFWAFSNEQFAENKTPLKEGEKYVSIGHGGYLPKTEVDNFTNGMAAINKWYKEETSTNKKMRRTLIAYELANHEAYYTGDITDTMQTLGKGYTKKEVWKVWHEENKKNQEAGIY